MKQCIAVEQLKELDDLQLMQLCRNFNWNKLETKIEWMYLAECLNIGKMIEILSNYKQIEIIQAGKWWVMFMDKSLKVSDYTLCDALWEAVKEVI